MRKQFASIALVLTLVAAGLATAWPSSSQEKAPQPAITVQQPRSPAASDEPAAEVNVTREQRRVHVRQPADEGEQRRIITGDVAATGTDPLYAMRGDKLVGKPVYGADRQAIGEINAIVLSRSDRNPVAVIGVGGVLGIGERNVAVPLDQLQLGADDRLTTSMTKDSLGALEAYDASGYRPIDLSRTVGEALRG